MRGSARKNLLAIVAGAVLAAGPLLAFNYWLNRLIDRQGQEEIDTSASRAISLAEARVNSVTEALDALATQGVEACRPSQIEAMRYAAFDAIPIKELSIVASDGQTLCTHLGLPIGQRKILSSEPLNDAGCCACGVATATRSRSARRSAPSR